MFTGQLSTDGSAKHELGALKDEADIVPLDCAVFDTGMISHFLAADYNTYRGLVQGPQV